MPDGRPVVSGLLCLFFAGIIVVALGWSSRVGLAPLVVGCTGLVLSLLQLVEDVRASRDTPLRIPKAAWALIAWSFVFVLSALVIGLLPGAFVSIIAFLRLHEGDQYRIAISVSALYTGSVWLLFDVILELTLFGGLFDILL